MGIRAVSVVVLCCLGAVVHTPRALAHPTLRLCAIHPLDVILDCDDHRSSQQPASPVEPAATAKADDPAKTPLAVLPPAADRGGAGYVPNLLMVRFRPGLSPADRRRVLARTGAVADREIEPLGVVVVRTAPAGRERALAALRASPDVAGVERDAIVTKMDTTPNDTDWSDQWGLQRIGLPAAWEKTTGSGVTVAVLDTGVDADHPDLRGAVLPGFDFTGSPRGAADVEGHGTSVAGIIAARSNNHQGIAGVCWACSILPLKVLGDDGAGTMDQLAEGIVTAVDHGARVLSMSLGGPVGSATLDQAIAYATAKGAILVAAAGNSGGSAPRYPAASPNVLSVAALDEGERLYSWSTYGPWVRLTAPGCNPASALAASYAVFCGTSSATPIVSGMVALALSIRPSLDREEIAKVLSTTSVAVPGVPQGRVDALATVQTIASGKALGPAGPRVTVRTIRGALTPQRTWRVHQQVVGAGSIAVNATFTRGVRVTLSLIGSSNKIIAEVSGNSPLKLSRNVGAGLYWVGVAAGRGADARYALTVRAAS